MHSAWWSFVCAGVAAPLSFLAVDAAVRLLVLLVRRPEGGAPLLTRALAVISQGPFPLRPFRFHPQAPFASDRDFLLVLSVWRPEGGAPVLSCALATISQGLCPYLAPFSFVRKPLFVSDRELNLVLWLGGLRQEHLC